jgi:L-2-hydroxyglutarate oxidase LhgO
VTGVKSCAPPISQDSKKAKLCVRGRHLLYDFCNKYNVNYLKTGKLIVAINEKEEKEILKLYENGIKNSVEGLEILESSMIRKLEGCVKGKLAIYSKETGILDSHGFMKRLYHLSKNNGVIYAFKKKVEKVIKNGNGYKVFANDGEYVNVKYLINAGGLYADKNAQMLGINVDEAGYRISYYKGDYYYYSKPSFVKMLIYPVPHSDLRGLGIHITVDLSGRMKFGPDVYEVNQIDYKVDPSKRDTFFEKASMLINGLDKDAIFPDTSGIRPKLKGSGIRDFVINEESSRGLNGIINLIGIESPGLTSALAIGEYIMNIIKELDN